MICYRCGGSKKFMGNGMVMMTCYNCDERGIEVKKEVDSLIQNIDVPEAPVDRQSASYKKAITEIMALNPNISRKDAVKIFDKEYHMGNLPN